MTPSPTRRSLQTRLALAYAAGIYAAGVFVLVFVDVPLAGVQSTTPKGHPSSGTITGTEDGVGLPQLLMGSAVALIALIPVALALGWFVAGRFLHPLRAITATAKVISAGDLHRRLGLGEPADELTELGHTLDDLFARLQASFDAQRHFVANASHELRTPLAGLRTLLEVALADPDADAATLRAACQEALALGGHQERLVKALLALATSERGISRRHTLDLARLTAEVLASRRDRAAETGIDLVEHLTPAVTAGDPRLVESLIANLIDNAVRHNHPGGHVEVTTRTSGTQVTLTVGNSGPVIPDDQVQRLFQPFQRLAPDRNGRHDGHGLGLAIVDAVTRAHHATLTAGARPEGGLSITVRFAHASQSRSATAQGPRCDGPDAGAKTRRRPSPRTKRRR
ncbi:ATP-binding protein [Actinoallomurus oryzae]|uniref:histidine kinase n=1 Tax=Actinoallomurus oryzae TaxID=502180 RepID=A0ABP8R3F1_9ACTN